METEHLQVRRAVREALADLPSQAPVLVACSGGADSLSLAAATAFEVRRSGRRAGGVSIDHGLQSGTAERARRVAAVLCQLGLDPVETVHLNATEGRDGPEGNARRARYRALNAVATRHGAAAILLGHTLDDQAETVLLGLARGSGGRSLSGMAPASKPGTDRVQYLRPLLKLPRNIARSAVPTSVRPWNDPHNADPRYARARVRHNVLPVLEAELGPGIAEALARTADLLRADAEALDSLSSDQVWRDVAALMLPDQVSNRPNTTSPILRVDELVLAPRAIRWRVLRRAAIAAGCSPTDLTAAHVEATDTLIVNWRGQKGIDLPGSIRAWRSGQELRFESIR